MVDSVYCTVAQLEQANAAIARMQQLGVRPEDVIVANQPSEVESLVHAESEAARSTLIGVAFGFAAGVVVGFINLYIIGVWSLYGILTIPTISGVCWGLVGSIVGCGGILTASKVPAKIAHRFEEEVAGAKVLLTVPLLNKQQLADIRSTLLEVGASNIFYSGDSI